MSVLDEALSILQRHGPKYGPYGNSNHGPMAAEALTTLGRDAAVLPWVERYATSLDDQPTPVATIDPADWREALGKPSRCPHWRRLFGRELAEQDDFAPVIGQAGPSDDASAFLADLTGTMAAVYAVNTDHGTDGDFAFIHAVTGLAALRLLLPHLGENETARALRYAWQVAAAIYAVYSDVQT